MTTSVTILWQLLVSLKGILVADFLSRPLSLPSTFYWNANILKLGEVGSLRVSGQGYKTEDDAGLECKIHELEKFTGVVMP